jgi:peptidoglycan/LPS O-acetylase OafA/YrhL
MSQKRIPEITALRALAALLVLIYHSKFIDGGYIGVDIFYVISGYLITGLLLRELEVSGKLNFKEFYARRAKRLLPSSLLVICVTGISGWFLLPSTMRETFGKDLIAASTYISNFLFALWQNDYQNLNSTPSPFIHYWSLAVEEQFYLFWPLLIVLLYRIGKRRAVFFGIATTVVASFLFSLYLTQANPIWAFYILPTRAWELGVGALLLFLPGKRRMRPVVSLFALLALLLASMRFDDQTDFPGIAALVPVIATAVLIQAHGQWPPFLRKFSNRKSVQWLGNISYPLYLWHWPVLVIPAIALDRSLSSPETLLCLVLIIAASHLTHYLVEQPLRYRKWSTRRIFNLVGVSTFVSILLGLGIYSSYSNDLTLSTGEKFSIKSVRANPESYSDGCHVSFGTTKSPACEYGDTSSDEAIVLYGDSHAAQWLPALDAIGRKNNLKIISLTKSACSSTELILPLSAQYSVSDCQRFRDSSVGLIQKIEPLAVVTSSYQLFKATDGSSDALKWWVGGQAKLFNRISTSTKFPVYISDTPRPQTDIPNCLSESRVELCATSKKIDPTTASGFLAIDPTPWLCGNTCPAVVDSIVAYRDQSHITVAMSKHLAAKLESALREFGVI